ncbi:MAG TPA: hypothetical protein VLA26_10060 [Gammaproteobacteria bacterium]|nr:hypothetical protein [Gammaproteobacteria bacterium]
MPQRPSYIMRDQVRNQVGNIMAWRPHCAGESQQPGLGRLLGRLAIRAADALYRSLQEPRRAARAIH